MSEFKRAPFFSALTAALTLIVSLFFFPKIIKTELINQEEKQALNNKQFTEFVDRQKKLPTENSELILAAVGDIMLSRVVADKIDRYGEDYPFRAVKTWLAEAEIVFGNLETPLTSGRRILTGEMVFRANPSLATTLKNYNFSILSLANNHTMNFGHEGIRQTFSSFDKAALTYVGAGENLLEARQAKYFEGQGIKLAFLAYNDSDVVPLSYSADENLPGTAFMDLEAMTVAVRQAKSQADFVIVSVHSGQEYEAVHSRRQEEFSRAAIDAGAELVIGHHPHVVQDAEIYKGKLIFYSLGNFIFDQMWSPETRQSLGVKIFFTPKGISRARLYPFRIDDYSQPNSIRGEAAREILERTKLDYQEERFYFWNEETQTFEKEAIASVNLLRTEAGNLFKHLTLNSDEKGQVETYELKEGRLIVRREDGELVWMSPEDWWIEDFVLADANGDGVIDVNMSVWRQDQLVQNFLVIYNLSTEQQKTVWESAALSKPICRFIIRDFNRDGKAEIAVLEGDDDDLDGCESRSLAIWSWKREGFINIWREPAVGYRRIVADGLGDRQGFVLE